MFRAEDVWPETRIVHERMKAIAEEFGVTFRCVSVLLDILEQEPEFRLPPDIPARAGLRREDCERFLAAGRLLLKDMHELLA